MLETLRTYMSELPVLAELVERELLNSPSQAQNTEDQRYHLEDLQRSVSARLKSERKLYAVRHFPESELHCPVCREVTMGYYWEINNPVTGKGLCVSYRLVHALVAHEQLFFSESLHNVAGTRVGEARLALDLPGMIAVMEGSETPEAVIAEARSAIALQQSQLQAAGPVVASGGGH